MQIPISKNRSIKLALGFDDVSLEPSAQTIDPDLVDISFSVGDRKFETPIVASAMDSVVDPNMMSLLTNEGCFGVLNLDGVWSKFENPEEKIKAIVDADDQAVTAVMQEIYQTPSKPDLALQRVRDVKKSGAYCAVSCTPSTAIMLADDIAKAGADLIVIQSTVTSVRHRTTTGKMLNIADLCVKLDIPIWIGNTSGYQVSLDLMRAGAAGILVGVGPGAACTTRGVTGVGVPQITATAECAAARDDFFAETNRYVNVITDGGMRKGGEICKALASGADLVMIGSPFASCPEAPSSPYHWGMATPHPALPRGVRVKNHSQIPLKQLIHGPAKVTDGTQNLVGAIRSSMGLCGAATIKEFRNTQLIFSLSFMSEGKQMQRVQELGMGSK